MAFHEPLRQMFLQQSAQFPTANALERMVAPLARYAVRAEPAHVTPDSTYWRVVGIHHLTPEENRGGHQILVDVLDENGQRIPLGQAQIRWGWEGQQPHETAPPRALDKPLNEPATNIDLYANQRVWLEVDGAGLPSDRISNLSTAHPDEPGPNGELWNSWGHHSYYVVFQRSRVATQPSPGPVTTTSEPAQPPPLPPAAAASAPIPDAPPVAPPPPAPSAPMRGNRLGFYLHVSIDQDGLWEAIRQVQPPVILVHADTLNRMLLREIRSFRAPNAFVIGRLYKDNHTQRMMLTNGDPAGQGRAMADEILTLDFGLATERGANGRLLIDAWISLNEAVPGPASRQFAEEPGETAALLHAYDLFQVAFRQRLQEASVEAVAFNFGAGNFTQPEHYLDHFPNTLANYTYLGFHEYGWPTLQPAVGSATSAGLYRTCMAGIRARFGPRHRVVITEAGLARMYQDASAGDVGWLNSVQPLSQDHYWQSLEWYNQHLLADDYAVGACLYQVGHHGDWATFRHLGQDNTGQPLRLIERVAALSGGARGHRSRGQKRGSLPSSAPAPSTQPQDRPPK